MPSHRRTAPASGLASGPASDSASGSGCGSASPPVRAAWELVGDAADAVRALNHRTLASDGYAEPADVDAVLFELTRLAWELPQALAQAGRWLTFEHDAGRVRHDTYPAQVGAAVDSLLSDLIRASAAAETLAQYLDAAREHSAHLGVLDSGGNPPGGTR